jgi:hypothetical protein
MDDVGRFSSDRMKVSADEFLAWDWQSVWVKCLDCVSNWAPVTSVLKG